MDINKQADEFFFRLQIQMNSMNIDKLASNLKTHELATLYIIDSCGCEKDGVYVSEIAEGLHIPISAVSRILKRLEYDIHYIERRTNPKDRRNTIVSMSEEGKKYYDKTMDLAKAFGNRIFSSLTLEEQQLYFQLSEKLKEAAEIEFAKLYEDSI